MAALVCSVAQNLAYEYKTSHIDPIQEALYG
jgi:hypothetical protein